MVFTISIAVLALILFKIFGGFGTHSPVKNAVHAHHWKGNGAFKLFVIVESHSQNAIAQIASTPLNNKQSAQLAHIIPESGNEKDPFAVRIELNGKNVGYLTRDDALKFRRRLALRKIGMKATTCNAEIRGGSKGRDGKTLSYAVFLDMMPFENVPNKK